MSKNFLFYFKKGHIASLVRQECERQKCERHQCKDNCANANSAKETTVRTRQECECQKCECQQCDATSMRKNCDNSANDNSANRLFFLSFCSKQFFLWHTEIIFFTQNDWYWFRIWTERKMNESQRKECARWPVVPLELTIFFSFLSGFMHTFNLACLSMCWKTGRGKAGVYTRPMADVVQGSTKDARGLCRLWQWLWYCPATIFLRLRSC